MYRISVSLARSPTDTGTLLRYRAADARAGRSCQRKALLKGGGSGRYCRAEGQARSIEAIRGRVWSPLKASGTGRARAEGGHVEEHALLVWDVGHTGILGQVLRDLLSALDLTQLNEARAIFAESCGDKRGRF